MPELDILDGLLAKTEVTYGTDAAPSNVTDGVRINQRLWSNIELDYEWENLRDDAAAGSIIPVDPALPRGRKAKIEIFWEVKGAGIDAPPEAAPLYIACALPETDGALMFDYGPVTSGTKGSCTLWCYAGKKLIKVTGCRGRFRWPLVVGEVAVHHFTMYGIVNADPTNITVATVTYDSAEPIAGVNTTLTVGGVALEWQSGELDLTGVDPVLLKNGSGSGVFADGIASFDFGQVDPTFRLGYRVVDLSGHDPFADRKAQTARTLVMTFGSAQFNRVKIVGAPLKIRSHKPTASEGFTNYDIMARVSSGGIVRFD